MEDNMHGRGVDVVHNTIILLNGAVALSWWYDHALCSQCVIPGQHTTQVHALLPLWIWP